MNKPKNLDEALDTIIRDTPKENLDKFRDTEEKRAGAMVHHAGGMNMRNSWNLWDNKSPMAKWFHSIGIWHADDMSGIIFDSLHRKLNNEPLDLEGQVKVYHDYWRGLGQDPAEELKKAKQN